MIALTVPAARLVAKIAKAGTHDTGRGGPLARRAESSGLSSRRAPVRPGVLGTPALGSRAPEV